MLFRALVISTAAATTLSVSPAFAETQTYDLSGFDAISVSAGITAEVEVGGDFSVRAEGSSEALERLDIRVRGDELDIGRKSRFGFNWGRNERVTVYVTLPALNGLDVSSGASADATGVEANRFNLEASSGASVDVSGVCGDINVDVSSGASADASALECETGTAGASSGASARLFTSQSINADASSGGSIRVYGNPGNTNIDRSSGGSVKIAN